MRSRIDRIEVRIAQAESGKATGRSSPEELWTLASQAFEVKRYKEAIATFERLAETFPTHVRADDALYFRGQSYGHLAEWNRAIAAYQRLRTMYPESALADDGLYFAAVAAVALKNCTEARTYLAIVKARYRKTNVSSTAQKLDAQIRRDAKKPSVCAS
jgi:TolA-binding protein